VAVIMMLVILEEKYLISISMVVRHVAILAIMVAPVPATPVLSIIWRVMSIVPRLSLDLV
jgi:hypothetical protein